METDFIRGSNWPWCKEKDGISFSLKKWEVADTWV